MLKSLTTWITTNCGKFLKRWEHQITLPVSWETCVWIKKQELEWDMEQWTGSKLGKEYNKAVYCHPAYLTYIQSSVQFRSVAQSWPTLSLSSFTFITRLFSFSLLSAIRVVSSTYLRFLMFLPAILISACASPVHHFTWCTLLLLTLSRFSHIWLCVTP